MRRTAVALIALAAVFAAPPAIAQATLEDVYDSLALLQDANLGIARQMAELEQQAASELEAAITSKIGNSASQAIARTFVANARTLAAIMLSPMQTYTTAAGETMFILVRRNIELLRGITSFRAADQALDAAITRYTVLQMQTQDMAEALQNGWTRYGDVLKRASQAGLLAENAFDPDTQSWSLGTPVLGAPPPAEVAVVPAPTVAAPTTTVTESVAAVEPTVTPAPADLASTVTPLVVPDTVPVPTTTLAEVPSIEDSQPAEPVVTAEAETEERLPAEGPLDVAETQPMTIQMGGWTIATSPSGEAVATAVNLVGETRGTITSLSMTCAPDQSVAYAINGSEDFSSFRIYADRSQNVTVSASSNVVLGPDAEAMAMTLSSAVAWAQQVPDGGRSLTIRTADAEGVLALFPPSGYLDARAAVESACENPGTPVVATAPEPEPEPEAEITAETAPEAGPIEEPAPEAEPEPAPTTAATTTPTRPTTAPIPRPPLDRSRLPSGAAPLSLM